jgi:hypothetical protein
MEAQVHTIRSLHKVSPRCAERQSLLFFYLGHRGNWDVLYLLRVTSTMWERRPVKHGSVKMGCLVPIRFQWSSASCGFARTLAQDQSKSLGMRQKDGKL